MDVLFPDKVEEEFAASGKARILVAVAEFAGAIVKIVGYLIGFFQLEATRPVLTMFDLLPHDPFPILELTSS